MRGECICPYCNIEFHHKAILDEHQYSSCNCGAMLCLCLEDDEMVTRQEIAKDYPFANIHLLRNIDSLSESSRHLPHSRVSAFFWKA
ncbi:MAG: hypothetical protein ACOYUZ_04470 [Patescibacteria group bacterium]